MEKNFITEDQQLNTRKYEWCLLFLVFNKEKEDFWRQYSFIFILSVYAQGEDSVQPSA